MHKLTNEELEIVAEKAESYPVGLPTDVWGAGPMAGQDAGDPTMFEREVLETYG